MSPKAGRLIEYENIPRCCAIVASAKFATWVELDTVLGVSDLYDLLEINAVNNHNQYVMYQD